MTRAARSLGMLLAAAMVVSAVVATSPSTATGPVHAAHPGANGVIAFLDGDPDDGGFDVFAVEPDGSGRRQLTDFDGIIDHPDWSPDGQRIALDTFIDSPSGCHFGEIWVVAADGTGATQLTATPDVAEFDPTWSPDGQRIAYSVLTNFDNCNRGDIDLWVMNADGTGQTQITSGGEPGSMSNDTEPAWSPNADRIAFTSDRENANGNHFEEIYTIASDGSGLSKLTAPQAGDVQGNEKPAWSPDGQHIAFRHISFVHSNWEIWVMGADGSDKVPVTRTDGAEQDFDPEWSPDGQRIVFMGSDGFGSAALLTVSPGGGDETVLVPGGGAPSRPTWRPLVEPAEPDLVVDDCAEPSLATLTSIEGDLVVDAVPGCAQISLPDLTAVGGSIALTNNTAAGDIDLGSLATVGGTIALTNNTAAGNIDLGSLTTVGGTIALTNNTAAGNIDLGSLGAVAGDVTIVDNGDATVAIGSPEDVAGDLTIESNGTAAIALGNGAVAGDLTLDLSGYDAVSGSTGGGASGIAMATGAAVMRALLPDGAFETSVPFAITRLDPAALLPEAGTDAGGQPATIDPIEGYSFEFGVPTLGVDATLTFEARLDALDGATVDALLAALGSDRATLVTRVEGEGATYQAFPVCSAGEAPTAGGCVLVEQLDAAGQPTAGQPTIVRFGGVVGHFSSWAVALITTDADTTPPVVDDNADLQVEATGPDGAPVTYTSPAATDDVDGAVPADCAPASGSTFGLGTSLVTCSASDAAGNTGSSAFAVTVADTTAPAITVPAPITTDATGPGGAIVGFVATTSDAVDGLGEATCTPVAGSLFPVGSTVVTCAATDAAGNGASAPFTVTVRGAASPPGAPVVSALAGWNAVTVSWSAPTAGSTPVTGYIVRALVGDAIVAVATLGPAAREHTFGGLPNHVAHTFSVVALNDSGSGPAGRATATPTVPRRHRAVDVDVVCPSFVVRNPNPYPVHISWVTIRGQTGRAAIPAGATQVIAPAPRGTGIAVFAGVLLLQDAGVGKCPR